MVNWTDKIIHWNQLGSTELKRLIDTWGKDEKFIAKYDEKHGHVHTSVAVSTKPSKVEKAVAVKKVVAKKAASVRQKHTGKDGEVKFVEHRNLYVGFFGGKVVVTKRTQEQCLEVLRNEYKMEV